jgi:tetratricopeptide (TPR) repeat protein
LYLFKKREIMRQILAISMFLVIFAGSYGQETSVREEFISFPTYAFSDPDPVARPGKIYPYFKFDGYTSSSEVIKHKMVVLENRWIKVWIAPDIGGKVWGAMDKQTGKYFIYHNNVAKFRNIAMRGPWTSGGIEFNFGSIGHAPTTSTPVDYHYQYNPDGSVSCFIGAIELTSRTEWRVEIRLPADKAWFETRSYWNNPTNLKTSLYHWQTAAADAGDDLRYYFPGNAYIGHEGEASGWPLTNDSRDISLYRNNDYGSHHSYHVLGEYTDWFAGYFQKSDFGFGHWSRYPYKPGKKIWIWSLSRSGAIWVDLLTDPSRGNGQYTEIQTGLLFNQEADESTMSPFKHLFFEPGAVESFRERWFPVSGTGGVTSVSQEGILNIGRQANGFRLIFQALAYVKDNLQVTDKSGKILFEENIALNPEELYEKVLEFSPVNVIIKLKDGDLCLDLTEESEKNNLLDRPMKITGGFDWESVYGLYTKGIEKSRQRLYDEAKTFLNKCLAKDPYYMPAYTSLAEIDLKEMRYDDAEKKVLHVLSFNTYDPDANFLYGTLLGYKGEYNKARDAFGVTLRSPAYKSVSLNQLALLALKQKRYDEAWDYVMDAGLYNGMDINIYKTAAVIARLRGDEGNYRMLLRRLLTNDPLCHMAAFERYYSAGDSISRTAFTSTICGELKYETYIELALWYLNAGLQQDALAVMNLCPENPLADFLSAYLAFLLNDRDKSSFYLTRANRAGDELVFPFRYEYREILKWAEEQQPGWKVRYYTALLYWSRGQNEYAGKYFSGCGDLPDSYSFYLSRGVFNEQTGGDVEKDFMSALKYGENNWRPYHYLHGYYLSANQYDKALDISLKAMKKFNSSFIVRFDHAQSLLNTGKFDECVKLLETTEFLPAEGSEYGRIIWMNANILNALNYYSHNKLTTALKFTEKSYLWPENLGVGKPYDVDERKEHFLKAMILDRMGRKNESESLLGKIIAYNNGIPDSGNPVNYLTVLALNKLNRKVEASVYFNNWVGIARRKVVSEWAELINSGQMEKASDLLMEKAGKAGSRSYSGEMDNDLKLVNEIVKKYLGTSGR